MRLIILTLVLLVASGGATTVNSQREASGGPANPKELEQFLDGFFDQHMQKEHIPGAAFVFVKDNKVFFKKGYGFANLERQQRVSPDSTIFRIGSISKVFTADAIVQLADQRKIKLNADVNQYLKRVKVPATFAEPVTAAHLISHTAGFDEIRPGTQGPDQESVLPLADFLRPRLVRLWRPGQLPMYTTYGITLAGALVEDVTGLSFEEYLARNIWQPLGMKRTNIVVPPGLKDDLAVGYEYVEGTGTHQPQRWEWYHTTPASSINSTAADMAIWMVAHLQEGRYANVRIISEQAAREMHRTQATGHPGIHGFAYGFYEEMYGDSRILEHGGNMAGFSSLVVLIPEQNAGFFVVGHGENSQLRENLKWALMERYYSPVRKASIRPAPHDFNARAHLFVGRYGWITYCHSCQGGQPSMVLRITANSDGSLSLNGRRWIEVEPLFFVREDGASKIAFRADASGRITHMFSGGFWVFEKLVP
ncbi:MAG TPA: serine hydrolase domain-containing protein [Pyrinomonadaceae bacterium]|nr:serine hydrolase domain-containing protein [Pyrinomonadaceae bacterium]